MNTAKAMHDHRGSSEEDTHGKIKTQRKKTESQDHKSSGENNSCSSKESTAVTQKVCWLAIVSSAHAKVIWEEECSAEELPVTDW